MYRVTKTNSIERQKRIVNFGAFTLWTRAALAPRAMSVEMDELRRLETCAAGSYEVGELVARGGLGGCVVVWPLPCPLRHP